MRDHVAAIAQVSDAELAEAVRFLARAHGIVAEGAGAAAVAGLLAGKIEPGGGPVVAVITGRNVTLPRLGKCSRARRLASMPCLIALFALIGPRVALIFT